MRPGRPSLTAIGVASLRALAEVQAGSVSTDALAAALLPRPYREIVAGLRYARGATSSILSLADRLSGGGSRHIELRTRAIDDAVREHVGRGIRRVILLGAGLDARPYRLSSLDVTWVEIDFAATQAMKKRALGRAGIDVSRVRFFATDFRGGDLRRILDEAVLREPVLVLWEGVPMYLDDDALWASLRALNGALPLGSGLALTYLSKRPPTWLRLGVALARERFESVMTEAALADLLLVHGFRVSFDEGNPEWLARYLRRPGTSWSIERLAVAMRV